MQREPQSGDDADASLGAGALKHRRHGARMGSAGLRGVDELLVFDCGLLRCRLQGNALSCRLAGSAAKKDDAERR